MHKVLTYRKYFDFLTKLSSVIYSYIIILR